MEGLHNLQQELKKLAGQHWIGTIKNSCTIRDFLAEKYPQVSAVDIRYHDCVIYITRDGYPLYSGHEIYIRDDNWRDTNTLDIKLNWFSSEITLNETTYLDYIEVLGYMGTQFKSKDSEFFKVLEKNMLEYARRTKLLDDIEGQISDITASIANQQYEQQKELFFNEILPGNYYVNQTIVKNKKILSAYMVNKVNTKTVDFNEIEKIDAHSVRHDLSLNWTRKRIKLDDVYPKLYKFTRVIKDELDAIIVEALIYNAIGHKLYWDGLDSLDDGLVMIVLLTEKKLIPNNHITEDLDRYIKRVHKELKEIGKTTKLG